MAHAELTEMVAGEVEQSPRRRSLLASIENVLGSLVEIPAALLVVAEIVILFAGVVARYGLHQPLIWSDELASILFLWLAMLGAAVAFRRAEHMRMTAIVASATPAMRTYLDLVSTCVPIAFGFGLAIFGYLALTTRTPLMVLVGRMDEGMSHLILLSVPLFVFLGLLIEMTGMARAMVAFLASLLDHIRGGLHYVLVGAMYLVSGISGSKAADMAAVAPVLFPEMKARGAKPGDLVALLSATGAQTETIPPSLVLITIGSVTGVSIAALFTGGLLPGVVLAITLSALVWWRYRGEDLSGA